MKDWERKELISILKKRGISDGEINVALIMHGEKPIYENNLTLTEQIVASTMGSPWH